jgi:pyruvate formate lyase activating enzyme
MTNMKVANVKDFKGVLKMAEHAKGYGMHAEVVTNIIPGLNDGKVELKGIASWIREKLGPDTCWHVTRFYPHHELVSLPPTPSQTWKRHGRWEKMQDFGMST